MTTSRRPSVNSPRFSWQLKVELLDVRPTVWRRLIVPERIALPKLHQAFQEAFGWTDSHLHEFLINGRPPPHGFLGHAFAVFYREAKESPRWRRNKR